VLRVAEVVKEALIDQTDGTMDQVVVTATITSQLSSMSPISSRVVASIVEEAAAGEVTAGVVLVVMTASMAPLASEGEVTITEEVVTIWEVEVMAL